MVDNVYSAAELDEMESFFEDVKSQEIKPSVMPSVLTRVKRKAILSGLMISTHQKNYHEPCVHIVLVDRWNSSSTCIPESG